jgi:hypothetical protein
MVNAILMPCSNSHGQFREKKKRRLCVAPDAVLAMKNKDEKEFH